MVQDFQSMIGRQVISEIQLSVDKQTIPCRDIPHARVCKQGCTTIGKTEVHRRDHKGDRRRVPEECRQETAHFTAPPSECPFVENYSSIK